MILAGALWLLVAAGERRATAEEEPLSPIRIAEDGSGFIHADTGKPYRPWGFNYLGRHGELAEETWDADWERIETDFREMRRLGANVVRWHLQLATFMKSPTEVDATQLERLRRLLDLARDNGLYLDLTGLSCYRREKVPAWYDDLLEAERWQVQARFWEAIAGACAGHPAVFCYDLMNEPVVGPAQEGYHPWLAGELGGLYFVQRISNELAGRTNIEIADAWVEQLTTAIRRHDPDRLITVGVIPWAQIFPGAKPIFYATDPARHLDFVSVHFYPQTGKAAEALTALAAYDIGKPLVVEEIYPLACSVEELDEFIDGASDRVDGWVSHYFGHTPDEHRAGAEPGGPITARFLDYWQEKGQGESTAR